MKYDLIIIGSGPGGYEMAAIAASKGLSVAIVEKNLLGGTCLNRGCIPTKTLCRNAQVLDEVKQAQAFGIDVTGVALNYRVVLDRMQAVVAQLRSGVETLLNSGNVAIINGEARLVDSNAVQVGNVIYEASNIVIATGSKPKLLPVEGAQFAMLSDDIVAMDTLPQSIVIVGGGVIGMEYAAIFNSFGVKVTVVEFCKDILPPFDADVAKRLRKSLEKQGVEVIVQAAVEKIEKTAEGKHEVSYLRKGKAAVVQAEEVLMAVGRTPVLPEGVEQLGIATGKRGIEVDNNMLTSIPGIYAIGDVNGLCMLAHAAAAQGKVALAHILGAPSHINLGIVPSAVFTQPELSMVGLTEQQCRDQGLDVTAKKGLFRNNGKALAMGETDGLVKMIVDNATRKVLGCHICGPHAADLIQEVVQAMNDGATVDALANAIHGHPTLGEALQAVAAQF